MYNGRVTYKTWNIELKYFTLHTSDNHNTSRSSELLFKIESTDRAQTNLSIKQNDKEHTPQHSMEDDYSGEYLKDKIRGMIMGGALGDALGVPHEFKCNRGIKYTGLLEYKGFMVSRWQGRKESEIGQVSDDTEMTLALLRTIVKDKTYVRNNVILAYIDWANSGGWMMGKNTRALLKGIKTIRGYEGRMKKILDLPEEERSQSNGFLMRCSPLALLNDPGWDESIITDANITNPQRVCIECSQIYITCLRLALRNTDVDEIFNTVKEMSTSMSQEIKDVFRQIRRKEKRDITINKGWCCHALYCTLYVMLNFRPLEDSRASDEPEVPRDEPRERGDSGESGRYNRAMEWVIDQPGSDTDTNAAIAGSLLGALMGFKELRRNPITKKNIDIVINCDVENGPTPRPKKYTMEQFYDLTRNAARVFPLSRA
jgi:ADP-ribosyl-[dinitrogen reductase] hydrolase